MSDKLLVVPFEGKTKEEVDTTGTYTFTSYERLRKLLELNSDLDEGEKITGLIITPIGIKIRID